MVRSETTLLDSIAKQNDTQNHPKWSKLHCTCCGYKNYANTTVPEHAIAASIYQQAATLTDDAGNPTFTPDELQQLSHEVVTISPVTVKDGTDPTRVRVSLSNTDYAEYGEGRLQRTSVLAALTNAGT